MDVEGDVEGGAWENVQVWYKEILVGNISVKNGFLKNRLNIWKSFYMKVYHFCFDLKIISYSLF